MTSCQPCLDRQWRVTGARGYDLTRPQRHAELAQFIGQPGESNAGIAEHVAAMAGISVATQRNRRPSQPGHGRASHCVRASRTRTDVRVRMTRSSALTGGMNTVVRTPAIVTVCLIDCIPTPADSDCAYDLIRACKCHFLLADQAVDARGAVPVVFGFTSRAIANERMPERSIKPPTMTIGKT